MKIIIHSAFDKDIGLAFSRTEINSNLCRKEGIKRISQFVFLITFEKFFSAQITENFIYLTFFPRTTAE